MTTGVSKELNKFLMELVRTLVSVIEQKDPFLKGHSERVAAMSQTFAKTLELPDKNGLDNIYLAGLLHDIGMVYMPTEIIQKTGRLTRDEMMIIRQHPVLSENVLSHLSLIKHVMPMIRHHHEDMDGSGYPDGLNGNEIPMGARILHMVDSYDAMVSARPHRQALSPAKALESIYDGAGRQFDARFVDPFIAFIENKAPEIAAKSNGPENSPVEPSVREILLSIIQRFKSGDIELPVIPNIVQEIDRIIKNPSSTMDDLARVVEKDAVISLRLISISNSAIYRGFEEIRTLKQAIPRLGIDETRTTIQTIVNRGLYETEHPGFKKLMEKFWLHSLACAYGAREIAKRLKFEDTEKFFLLGLVHDIGKVLLLKTLSQVVSNHTGIEMNDVTDNIQKLHCSFGAALMRRWNFGNEFLRVATLHEGPKFSEDTEKEILTINLANLTTRGLGYSTFEETVDFSEVQSLKLLGLDSETVGAVQSTVADLMETTASLF